MRLRLIFLLLLFFPFILHAQFETESNADGIIFPRLTSAERDSLTPKRGQCIYNISELRLECFDGTEWHFDEQIDPSTILWTEIDTAGLKAFVLDCLIDDLGSSNSNLNNFDNHIITINTSFGVNGLSIMVIDEEGNTYSDDIIIPWDSNAIDTTGMKDWLMSCLPSGGTVAEDQITVTSSGEIEFIDNAGGTNDLIDFDLKTDSFFINNVYAGQIVSLLVNGNVAALDTLAIGGDGCDMIYTDISSLSEAAGTHMPLYEIAKCDGTFDTIWETITQVKPYLDQAGYTVHNKGIFVHEDGTETCIKTCDCPSTINAADYQDSLKTSCGWHTYDLSQDITPCINTYGDTLQTIFSISNSNVIAYVDPLTGVVNYTLDVDNNGSCSDFVTDIQIEYKISCSDGINSTGTYTAQVNIPCTECISLLTADDNTKLNSLYYSQNFDLAPGIGGIDAYSNQAHGPELFYNFGFANPLGTPGYDLFWKISEVELDCIPVFCQVDQRSLLFINDGTANAGVPSNANKSEQWGQYILSFLATEYSMALNLSDTNPVTPLPNDGVVRTDDYFNSQLNCDSCAPNRVRVKRYNSDGTPYLSSVNGAEVWIDVTFKRTKSFNSCAVLPINTSLTCQ